MLDADSVFERLLREAANLVPKMSTPKLTAALIVSSSLQQRITDTISTRIHQEQNVASSVEAKQLGIQGVHSIVSGPIISDDIMQDTRFLTPNETFTNRSVTTNYGALPFFPQLNQFAVSQRTATLVTITNPGGGNMSGATVVGTLSGTPGTAATLIQQTDQTRVTDICGSVSGPINNVSLVPSSYGQHFNSHHHQQPTQLNLHQPSISNQQQQHLSNPHQQLSQQSTLHCSTTSLNMNANGHVPGPGDGVDLKPDPVACLARAAVAGLNSTGESLFSTSTESDISSLGFMSMAPLGLSGSLEGTGGGPLVLPSHSQLSLHCVSPSTSNSKMDIITGSSSGAVTTVTTSVAPTNSNSSASKGGPYECLECGKEFRILRYLDKHRRIHTGEKPYQCCYCGRQFNDWPNMNRHKRIHTGERPYRCSVCTKTFSQPAVYNEHVKRHTGERPYICTVCAKGFPRSARLAVHMRVHTGERPYACSACDRRFSQPHHLAAHERIHNGDRPFPCSKCDVTFVCISNLRRHRRQAHPNPPSLPIAPPPPLPPPTNDERETPSASTGVSFMSPGSLLLTSSSASSGASPSRTDLSGGGGGGPFHQQISPSCASAASLATTTSSMPINDVRLLPVCSAAGEFLYCIDVSSNGLISSLSPSATTTTSVLPVISTSTGSGDGAITMMDQSSSIPADGGGYLYDTTQHQQMANGTIFVNSLDGTSQGDHLSGLHSTSLGSLVSSTSSSLPQIQIQQLSGMPIAQFSFAGSDKHHHQHQAVFPDAPVSSGDLHHTQQHTSSSSMTPIQICYSTGNQSDPGTLLLQSTNNNQVFSGHQSTMLVPIAAGGFFPQTGQAQQLPLLTHASEANWTSSFQPRGSPAAESTCSVTSPTGQSNLSRPASSASLVRDDNPPTPQLG